MLGGLLCVGFMFLVIAACHVVPPLIKMLEESEAAQAKARAEAADLELQKTQPEVWRNQQMVKIERERLAMQQKLAEQQLATGSHLANQENLRRNVGLGVTIFRIFTGS